MSAKKIDEKRQKCKKRATNAKQKMTKITKATAARKSNPIVARKVQCAANKKDGTRCNRWAGAQSQFCSSHIMTQEEEEEAQRDQTDDEERMDDMDDQGSIKSEHAGQKETWVKPQTSSSSHGRARGGGEPFDMDDLRRAIEKKGLRGVDEDAAEEAANNKCAVKQALEMLKARKTTMWSVSIAINLLGRPDVCIEDIVFLGVKFVEEACKLLGMDNQKAEAIARASNHLIGKRIIAMGTDVFDLKTPKFLRNAILDTLGERKQPAKSITNGQFMNMLVDQAIEVAGGWRSIRAMAGGSWTKPMVIKMMKNKGILQTQEFGMGMFNNAVQAVIAQAQQAAQYGN